MCYKLLQASNFYMNINNLRSKMYVDIIFSFQNMTLRKSDFFYRENTYFLKKAWITTEISSNTGQHWEDANLLIKKKWIRKEN